MLKRLAFVLVLLVVVIAGLQLSGMRDFTQIELAWGKYQQTGSKETLQEDILLILQGQKVREGALPLGRYADQLMYRWTDELGQVHVESRPPKTGDYETIRIGDLKFQIQEGLNQDEINATQGTKDE